MRSLFFLTVVIALIGFIAGCYSDDDGIPTPPQPVVGSVEIWMERDSVYFLYGDSVIVEGYVSVRDTSGNPVPNYPIHLYLTESVGRIEFVGPRQNTTNDSGFVYFRFRSFNQSGIQTIVAECRDHSDAWTLWVLGASVGDPLFSFSADRERLVFLPGQCDTVRLFAIVADSNGQGVPDTTVTLYAPCGTWPLFPPTNQAGRTETWWRVCEYGTFSLIATCGGFTRSLTINVVSPVASVEIWMETHQWHFNADGSPCRVNGFVTVKDSNGFGIPGAAVQMTLGQPIGDLSFLNPELADTTDANGEVHFLYSTSDTVAQIITVECGPRGDSWMLVIE